MFYLRKKIHFFIHCYDFNLYKIRMVSFRWNMKDFTEANILPPMVLITSKQKRGRRTTQKHFFLSEKSKIPNISRTRKCFDDLRQIFDEKRTFTNLCQKLTDFLLNFLIFTRMKKYIYSSRE